MPRMSLVVRLIIGFFGMLLFAACAVRMPRVPAVSPTPATAPQATPAQQALVPGQRYAIGQRTLSEDNVLAKVALEVRTAQVEASALVLRIAFVNTSEERFRLVGTIGGEDARLVDSTGREYTPTAVDPNLQALDPQGGFAPGTANVGNLTFPLPEGRGRYELRLPRYAPLRFELNTPLPSAVDTVADGSYTLETEIRSQRDALRPIAIRLHSLEIAEQRVSFSVGFVNQGRQGYDLLVGPNGGDARLVDGEGTQYAPTEVSEPIRNSIAPENGWQPQQENTGLIVFPRPTDLSRLRFVFPDYDALTIDLNSGGIASTDITSASGGPPAPTATPNPEEEVVAQVEDLLVKLSAGLATSDPAAYAEQFAPELRSQQEAIATRLLQIPMRSYTLQLAPGAALGTGDRLQGVPIELRYELSGVESGNPFEHDLRVDFARNGDSWQVTAVDPGENPPFWWLGDVVLRETPHFLIFARPESQNELPALKTETEQAYRTLQDRGLPLEPRYVTYFTATQEDFAALTGRTARYLGVALSRYEFRDDEITTTSRAFYINGATFRDPQAGFMPEVRQTTITHELVHLALANQTRPFTPPWLAEGLAVYLSEDTGGAMRQRLLENNRLTNLSLVALTQAGALGEHDAGGERASDEYAFAGETVAYLVERYGEATVLDFYRSYATVPVGDLADKLPRFGGSVLADSAFAELSADLTDDAVQRFLGVSLAQLDSDVKAWIAADGRLQTRE